MPLRLDIILTGLMALAIWGFIWRRSSKGPLRWNSPAALCALGVMMFYIIPSLYFQFRPWSFRVPPYFDGIPLVMVGAFILGLPLAFNYLVKGGQNRSSPKMAAVRPENLDQLLGWCFVIPVLLGMALRIYLITAGHQSRLEREPFSIGGSESLGLILVNFATYFPVCYFALVAFGTRAQRMVGKTFWVLDGCLRLWTLHRYEMCFYLLHSVVFLLLQGWRPKVKQLALIGCAIVFIIAVIGNVSEFEKGSLTNSRYLDLSGTLNVIADSLSATSVGKLLDDTFYRLYDARSASAVMINVPGIIPYFYGETFTHIPYSFIPRYFWEGKPDLGKIHMVTTWVMLKDEGINPIGTIGEFYINFGFAGCFLGGIAYLVLFRLLEKALTPKKGLGPAWLCVYPAMTLYIIHASTTFTRQVCEGLRGLLMVGMMALMFRFVTSAQMKKPVPRPAKQCPHLAARRTAKI